MQNEELQGLQRRKSHKKRVEDQPLPEVQKNKVDHASPEPKTESEKQHNAKDRVHPIQQNKPNLHNEGAKGNMEIYRKLKCVYCGYEIASKAKCPRCSKCRRAKFNPLLEFSVTKPYKVKGGATMAQEKENKKVEEEKEELDEEVDEIDDLFE